MTASSTAAKPDPGMLKLLVFDEEDLAVVSANLQDAIVRANDMAFLPREQRFALTAARFDWLAADEGRCERLQTGMHFERVSNVRTTGFRPGKPQEVLNLLSIVFEPNDAPSGEVVLTFSGGSGVRLQVECLEAQMRDIGPRWPCRGKPGHPADDAVGERA
ncbi:MAG: hypothetical protein QOG66_3240 [Methylobacteriaceae bacterium]|jgi:hypothetical protein|nr:hypothetical protein [Methylobacteriaceae bacterium]